MTLSDDGYSGANFNRPDWKRIIELVENDKVGIIIAKETIWKSDFTQMFFSEITISVSLLSTAVWTAPICRTMILLRS